MAEEDEEEGGVLEGGDGGRGELVDVAEEEEAKPAAVGAGYCEGKAGDGDDEVLNTPAHQHTHSRASVAPE